MDKVNFSAFCLVVLVALALAMCGVLLINSSTNIAYADNTITNLTNTTWIFNSDLGSFNDVGYFNITYTSNNTSYTDIYIGVDASDVDPASNQIYYVYRVYNSGWVDDAYRTITITGGSDVSNSTLINFMLNHATLYVPDDSDNITDLTGYTWVGNNTLNYTTSYSFNINFTCNNLSYNRFYFYDVDDDDYDELIYSGTGVLPITAYDWFEGDAWANVVYKTITFTGGSDVSNSSLISWLSNNGILTDSSNPEPDDPSEPDEPDEPSEPSQDYQDGYNQGYIDGRGSIYTGVLSDYTILSNYSTLGINNNALNISDSSETLSTIVMYSNFTINGYTINYGRYDIVGSDDNTGKYTLKLTGSTGYSGYKISSFNINENTLYKFMFNPEDSFNICISVPDNGSYLYWTYSLQTDGYINGVPYMDLTPYIKPWSSHTSCDIYLYNPNLRLIGAEPVPLYLHNTTPIYGLVANNLIVDNSNGNYNQGFKDGQVQGENIGFVKGWNQATSGSSNSFLGLFSAVLDAPINVISKTLNFELLGFNLRDFFFSMVSIAVILFILRLIL